MLNLLQNLYKEEHSFKEAAIDFTTKEGDILGSDKISGLETVNDCVVFHAGTASDISTGSPKTNGGRVLAVTALGDTLEEARATALSNAAKISYQGKYYRRDIGLDLLHFKPF